MKITISESELREEISKVLVTELQSSKGQGIGSTGLIKKVWDRVSGAFSKKGGEESLADKYMPADSKDIGSLDPEFADKVKSIIVSLEGMNFQPIIGSAYRNVKSQREKIAKGYSKKKDPFGSHTALNSEGKPAAYAVDLVDKRYGWSSTQDAYNFFDALGKIAKDKGMIWGGDWDRKDRKIDGKVYNIGWDPAHVQFHNNHSKAKAITIAAINKLAGKTKTV